MNAYDYSNLKFLLSLSDNKFEEWAGTLPDDDIEYAIELMQEYRKELALKETLMYSDEVQDTAVAGDYLKKYHEKNI